MVTISGYSEDNEVYIKGVKILNHRSNFSHIAHFFEKDTVSSCPFSIGQSNEYAEQLSKKGLINDYAVSDPVATYDLTEEGEELVNELESMLENIDVDRLNYQSVPDK